MSYDDPRGFVPGPEGKRVLGNAPQTGPDAVYSGHLECPCTDRVIKTVEHTYATQNTKSCAVGIDTADRCFGAAQKLAAKPSQLSATFSDTCDTTLAHPIKTQW